MEHGARAIQRNPDPTSDALADLGPDGPQQGLDISPAQIRGGRFREDEREGTTVTAIHIVMISQIDITGPRSMGWRQIVSARSFGINDPGVEGQHHDLTPRYRRYQTSRSRHDHDTEQR